MASNDVEKMDESGDASTSKSAEKPTDSMEINSQPICLIVLGMAGSGKTSFVKKLTQLGSLQNMKPYVVNLDPACSEVPYHANIGKCPNFV